MSAVETGEAINFGGGFGKRTRKLKRKEWVAVKVTTGLSGYLVAIPAGPEIIKGNPPEVVGHTSYRCWVRVRLKRESRLLKEQANAVGAATVEKVKTLATDIGIEILGSWS